jgi:hypothetical protein
LLNGLRDGPFAVAACHALDLESLRLHGKTPVDGWRVGFTLHPIMNLHIMSWSSPFKNALTLPWRQGLLSGL